SGPTRVATATPGASAPADAASMVTADAKPTDEAPAAHQFAAWLAAFNGGDVDAMMAYQKEHFTPELGAKALGADALRGFRQGTGGFELKKAEESSATRFVAVVKERNSDQFARVRLEVAAEEPHRVSVIAISAVPTPDEFRAPRMTEADALGALRAEIDKAVAADRFSGAVLIARGGVPIFAGAYGLADRERKIPNKLDTRFRIGSMNKMFTATAILQLVQAGKLATSDTLAKILPDYPNKQLASKVTIHHLLTHTGGTGDIFGPEFDAHRLQLRTIQDYVKLYGARDLEFEPGARWKYSNYGFLLLGAVIESVTRQSYYDWMSRHVFAPAAMTATASPVEGRADPARCVGYTRPDPDKPWASAADTLPYRGTSAGGGDSTVTDLLHFANALANHALLDTAHTTQLTTGKIETPGGDHYAYGFSDSTAGGVRCFGHGGGAPGMNGQLTICESGYTVAILANLDPPAASRLATFITDRLPASSPPAPTKK
ncbi:MAG TPA: serine hydrolase domain-containing protein, partial [Kofleriaceae bacterium]